VCADGLGGAKARARGVRERERGSATRPGRGGVADPLGAGAFLLLLLLRHALSATHRTGVITAAERQARAADMVCERDVRGVKEAETRGRDGRQSASGAGESATPASLARSVFCALSSLSCMAATRTKPAHLALQVRARVCSTHPLHITGRAACKRGRAKRASKACASPLSLVCALLRARALIRRCPLPPHTSHRPSPVSPSAASPTTA
jgi:hypothetical protein